MSCDSVRRVEGFTEIIAGQYTVQAHEKADPGILMSLVYQLDTTGHRCFSQIPFLTEGGEVVSIGGGDYGMGRNGTDHYFLKDGISIRWWDPGNIQREE